MGPHDEYVALLEAARGPGEVTTEEIRELARTKLGSRLAFGYEATIDGLRDRLAPDERVERLAVATAEFTGLLVVTDRRLLLLDVGVRSQRAWEAPRAEIRAARARRALRLAADVRLRRRDVHRHHAARTAATSWPPCCADAPRLKGPLESTGTEAGMSERALTRKGLLAGGAAGRRRAGGDVTGAGARPRHDDDIVGSWYGRVTADDPALGSFEELISFHRDGIVTDAHRLYIPATPFGPLLETSGHGAWKSTPQRLHGVLPLPAPAGAAVRRARRSGTDNVRLNIRLERGGNRFTGRFESTIRDTAGDAVFTATGDIAGERIIA